MNSRVAQNAINFMLSERFTCTGTDLLAAVEVVQHLQMDINKGLADDDNTQNPESGSSQTPDQ